LIDWLLLLYVATLQRPNVYRLSRLHHLLTTDLTQTLACSLILSSIDYCNAVLHGGIEG